VLVVNPAGTVMVGTAVIAALVSVAVTGQIVVVTAMTSVVTLPSRAGQSVTVAAQDVTV
jgi:hypothetical protein